MTRLLTSIAVNPTLHTSLLEVEMTHEQRSAALKATYDNFEISGDAEGPIVKFSIGSCAESNLEENM